MRKLFLFTSIVVIYSYGSVLDTLKTFSADFIQQIDDKENKIVKYEGHIYAKRPQTAKWVYLKPIRKDVYINDHSVVIIEPELEQVIMRNIKDDFNLFELLQNAKKISENKYIAHYNDFEFTLIFDGKDIKELSYIDNFENLVTIIFSHQQYNKTIDQSIFEPEIPKGFDVISQ